MSWGDSHGETFAEQAEARSRADHSGEKAATATHSKRFESPLEVGISRVRTSESLRRTVPHLPIVPGPGDVQWIRGTRSAGLIIVARQLACGAAR
jgi:hypothetical protein